MMRVGSIDGKRRADTALLCDPSFYGQYCPLGIDVSQANFSVGVFAHTLLADCEQTAQVIQNNIGQSAGAAASYEDLWKFTLVNYNAGAGCLGLAISETWSTAHKLTWEAMSSHCTDVCAPAKDYVETSASEQSFEFLEAWEHIYYFYNRNFKWRKIL